MENKIKVCKICGKQLSKGNYCSLRCKYEDHSNIIKNSCTPELKKLKSELFAEQTKDKQQKSNMFSIAKKIVIKERGNFCERCGEFLEKDDLIIHHKNGRKSDNDISNLQILCKCCHTKIHNEIEKISNKFSGGATMENYIAKILQEMNINLDNPNFKETPLRIARMIKELCESCFINTELEKKEILSKVFPSKNDQMIVYQGYSESLCPHHFLPVLYDFSIGIIPNKNVLGTSKIHRLFDLCCKKPELQEDINVEIVESIENILKPKGVACLIKGRHMCMEVRGIKKKGAIMTTSSLKGLFLDSISVRNEFYNII